MPQASGIITVVQEGRFRLDSGDGRGVLFTLDRMGPVEPQDLSLLRDGPVLVVYGAAPGLQGHVARDVRRLPE